MNILFAKGCRTAIRRNRHERLEESGELDQVRHRILAGLLQICNTQVVEQAHQKCHADKLHVLSG